MGGYDRYRRKPYLRGNMNLGIADPFQVTLLVCRNADQAWARQSNQFEIALCVRLVYVGRAPPPCVGGSSSVRIRRRWNVKGFVTE